MRSVLRWLRRLMLGVVLLAVLVTAALLIIAHTAWGRDWLRARIELALRDAFPGGARIARIDGSVLGVLHVRGIELDGRDGKPLITVGGLDVEVALWPLVVRRVEVVALVADDVRVAVRDQPPAPPARPEAPTAPSPWRVELPRVAIRRATLAIERGAPVTLVDVALAGGATVGAGGVTLFAWTDARWRERGLPIAAVAAVALDGELRLPAAIATLPGVTVGATGVVIDGDRPRGALVIAASAAAVRALSPAVAARADGDVLATLVLSDARATPGEAAARLPTTTAVALRARVGATELWAALRGDVARGAGRGVISARGVALAALGPALCGRGDALVALDGDAARLRGTVIAHVDRAAGVADGATCDPAVVPVRDAIVALDVASPARDPVVRALVVGGDPALRVVADGGLTVARGGVVLDDATRIAVTARGAAIAGQALSGRVVVAAGGSLAPALRVHARVMAAELQRGAQLLGSAELAGEVALGATSRVALSDLRVSPARGPAWTSGGATIVIADTMQLRGLALTSGDTTLVVRGDLAPHGGPLAVHIDATRIAAALIDPRARGSASGTIDVARRAGAWRGDVRLAVTGLAIADAPPIEVGGSPDLSGAEWRRGPIEVGGSPDLSGAEWRRGPINGTLHATLAGARATLALHATSPTLGGVALDVDVTGPRDPFDAAGWQALDRRAIHRAELAVERVTLAGLGAGWTGTLDGRVDLVGLRGALAVRGVALPLGALDGDLALVPRDGELGADASARLAGVAALAVRARIALPARPFAAATWRRRGRDLLREATATLDEVAFDPARLAQLAGPRAPALSGRLGAQLELGAEASHARLAIALDGVTGAPLAAPVAAHATIEVDDTGTRGRVELVGGARSLGALDLALAMPLDRWIDDPRAARRAALTGGWTLARSDAAAIAALVGRHELTGGSLEGHATVSGTIDAPAADATVAAHDLRVATPLGGRGAPALQDLAIAARWHDRLDVTLDGREASGGTLHAVAAIPRALDGATATLAARRFAVAALATVWRGVGIPTAGLLDGDAALLADGKVTGSFKLTGGVVPLGPAIGTLRDVTAALALHDRPWTATVDGRLGAGTVHLIAAADPALAALEVRTLELRDASLTGGLRPHITADVTARLARTATRITGTVDIRHAGVVLPARAGVALLDATLPGDLRLPGGAPPDASAAAPPVAIELDVALHAATVSAPDFSTGIDIAGVPVAGVRIDGQLHAPALHLSLGEGLAITGEVKLDRADILLFGRSYTVDPGDVVFDGPTDPVVALHLSHAFSSMTLAVDVAGRVSRAEPRFSSDTPGYSRDQLFGFFLGGEPGGDPATQTREAALGAGAMVLSSTISRQLNRISPIKLDAAACEPSTSSTSASCTFVKSVTDRVSLAYRRHVDPRSDENSGDAQVRIRMSGQVTVEGTGGDRGHYGADLLWRHRW